MIDSNGDDSAAEGILSVHNKKEKKTTSLCCDNVEEIMKSTKQICHILSYQGGGTHKIIETETLVTLSKTYKLYFLICKQDISDILNEKP